MNGMFTDRLRRVLKIAKEDCLNFGSDYIGTEHILLGLIKEGSGLALKALNDLGVDLDHLEDTMLSMLQNDVVNTIPLGVHSMLPFSIRAKRALENAGNIAKDMGYNYIGTEHILLGILVDPDTQASIILKNEGIDYEKVEKQIAGILKSSIQSEENKFRKKQTTIPPNLASFGRDLTEMAENGDLDPVVGRDKEIERISQVLSRRKKNNPVLIGEPGVGKTAIVEGLAQKIVNREVPEVLESKRIFLLDMASVVAGTKYRGQFEERLKAIVSELRKNKNLVVFIDELHTMVGAGGSEGSLDASNIIKPALSRGEIQAIGATTLEEYKKHIEKDGALERRFQTITVDPPGLIHTTEILKGLQENYEKHHKVQYTDEAISSAVILSDRYIQNRFLPDKAIDILDEAGARIRLDAYRLPPDVRNLETEIEKLNKKLAIAVKKQDYEEAAKLRDKKQHETDSLIKLRNDWKSKKEETILIVDEEHIRKVISSISGIPIDRIDKTENKKLLSIESNLKKRIIGQDLAIDKISKAIRRSRTGLRSVDRPIGSFLFLGTSGVGKTALAKELAELLFGSADNLIRFDMSEYMDKFNVSKLIGAPPGYVGYEEGGLLTEKVRRKPYSIVLLDEIEKAHPDIFNILLQIMDEGQLTDSSGVRVSFRNTIVIMTTNVGAKKLTAEKSMGFAGVGNAGAYNYNEMEKKILSSMKDVFNPEFINRIDETIVFSKLAEPELLQIIDIMLDELKERLLEKNIKITINKKVKEFIVNDVKDLELGARPLRRSIQKLLEDALAEEFLKHSVIEDANVKVTIAKNGIKVFIDKDN